MVFLTQTAMLSHRRCTQSPLLYWLLSPHVSAPHVSVMFSGGYSMGSFLYEFCATECPFLVIALLNIVDGVMRLFLVAPIERNRSDDKSGFRYAKQLLSDPDILAALGQSKAISLYGFGSV